MTDWSLNYAQKKKKTQTFYRSRAAMRGKTTSLVQLNLGGWIEGAFQLFIHVCRQSEVQYSYEQRSVYSLTVHS